MNGVEDSMAGLLPKSLRVQPISQTGVDWSRQTRQEDAPFLLFGEAQ
jgi:hypothetical protein